MAYQVVTTLDFLLKRALAHLALQEHLERLGIILWEDDFRGWLLSG